MIVHRLLCMIGVHHWTRKIVLLSWEPVVEIGEAYDQCDVCEKRRSMNHPEGRES